MKKQWVYSIFIFLCPAFHTFAALLPFTQGQVDTTDRMNTGGDRPDNPGLRGSQAGSYAIEDLTSGVSPYGYNYAYGGSYGYGGGAGVGYGGWNWDKRYTSDYERSPYYPTYEQASPLGPPPVVPPGYGYAQPNYPQNPYNYGYNTPLYGPRPQPVPPGYARGPSYYRQNPYPAPAPRYLPQNDPRNYYPGSNSIYEYEEDKYPGM